jgi:branched-chain amino acid transport system permease protein
MQTLVLSLFNGITYGMLLFLLAAGLTLVFSMLAVLNFAHAAFYMLGAYVAYTVAQLAGLGFWAGLIAAPLCCALVGAVVERWGLRRLASSGHVASMLFTFVLLFLMGEAVILIWGKQPVAYAVPAVLDFPLVTVMGVQYSAYRAFALAVSLVVLLGLFALLRFTRIGVVVRASLSRPDMVNALGHDLPTLRALVFVLGSALAGLAGALAGNILGTEPGMADSLGSLLMIVIVVGGLGSLAGAFWASLLIGVLQSFAVATSLSWGALLGPLQSLFDGIDALGAPISRIAPLIPYLLMMCFLVFRPRGLMGNRDL